MKVLLVNSSPHENGCVFTALDHMAAHFGSLGVETELFQFGRTPVAGCIACGACRKTGKCFKNDLVNEFAAKCETADGFVFGTPVYYAGPSGQLISFMDRLFFSAGRFLQNKPAAAVVSCRRGGASAAFESINKYFQISYMPVVSSQYWYQVHGSSPVDVLKDEEGLLTLRTLADNMTYLLRCLRAGSAAGISVPARETPLRTNFIR